MVLALFTLVPTIGGLALSLFSWDGGSSATFVGLDNFRAMMTDARFGPALRNTLVFVLVSVPVSTAAGLVLATAVNARWFVGRTFVRTCYFLPTVVSVIAIGFVWRWVLESSGGLLPGAMRWIGLSPPDFLQGGAVVSWIPGVSWPLLSIIVVQIWKQVGFCLVLYLAAISSVSETLYEAAEVDGASRWGAFVHITVPQVAPTTLFLLVTGVIGALQVFDVVWAMTGGSPSDATRVLNLHVFGEFQQSRLGYAAALGVVILALTAVVTAAQLLLGRERGRA
jgi:multiple sugar transport system permease protein